MFEDSFLDMEWEDRLSGFSGFGPDSPEIDGGHYRDDDVYDEPPEIDEDELDEDERAEQEADDRAAAWFEDASYGYPEER